MEAEAIEIVLARVDQVLCDTHDGAHTVRGRVVVDELLDLRIVVVETGTVDWSLPEAAPSRRTRNSRTLARLGFMPAHEARSA